jgi:hypothetical protein
MADEQNGNMEADADNSDQPEDAGEGSDFNVSRYTIVASGDTFVRYDTFTGVAWILQNPGSPSVARWVPVPEPEEDTDA